MLKNNNNTEIAEKKARMRVEALLILNQLKLAKPGDRFSFEEIASWAGISRPPISANPKEYGLLASARKECEYLGIQFQTVRTDDFHGLERLTSNNAVFRSKDKLKSAHTRLANEGKRLARIPIDELSEEAKNQFNSTMTILLFAGNATSGTSILKIDEKIESMGAKHPLPISTTIQLFSAAV